MATFSLEYFWKTSNQATQYVKRKAILTTNFKRWPLRMLTSQGEMRELLNLPAGEIWRYQITLEKKILLLGNKPNQRWTKKWDWLSLRWIFAGSNWETGWHRVKWKEDQVGPGKGVTKLQIIEKMHFWLHFFFVLFFSSLVECTIPGGRHPAAGAEVGVGAGAGHLATVTSGRRSNCPL